jgi:transposase
MRHLCSRRSRRRTTRGRIIALGRPVAFHLTGGEAADCKAYDALIDLPERAPNALLADKGYDADAIRADLAERKIEAVIPGRSNRRVKIEQSAL